MKCEEGAPLIEPYFDGELDEAESAMLAVHLESCATCRETLGELKAEAGFYRSHEIEMDVPETFWNDVFAKAAERASPRTRATGSVRHVDFGLARVRAMRFGPLAAAALVVLSVGITTLIIRYYGSRTSEKPSLTAQNRGPSATPLTAPSPSPSVQPQVDSAPASGPARIDAGVTKPSGNVASRKPQVATSRRQSPDDLVREAEQKYLTAIAILSRDANRRRQQLDTDSRAQFEQTMAVIDRAIANTRRAVNARPSDPIAVQYMLAAYSKKVDVLRNMLDD